MLLHVYYFEHLNLPDGGTSMRLLIWVLYAGIVIGSLLGTLDKVYCGAFVRALRQGGCVAAESAATLAEMDTRGKWYLRLALRPGKPLWKMIAVTEGEAGKARFYLPEEKRDPLRAVLAQDPRPSYQEDPDRVYGMEFAGYEVKFTVSEKVLHVKSVEKCTV